MHVENCGTGDREMRLSLSRERKSEKRVSLYRDIELSQPSDRDERGSN
jgi:hypothetical protein